MGFWGSVAEQLAPRPEVDRWDTPLDLACAIDPRTVRTPALELIARAVADALTGHEARLVISVPPQEGKSTLATKTGALWALQRNPDARIGIVSYAQSLAETFGRDIRNWVQTNNGDEGSLDLGIRIARDNGAARRWTLEGHRGGVTCVGVGSGLTGRPLDGLIIDDPLADAEQAESQYYRDKVWDWWQAVGATRLAPGGFVILILTRWHEDDLAGRFQAAEDGHLWKVINIPALADHKPDAGETDPLGRAPGEWLQSARGRSVEQWEAVRVRSGSRVFNALYQGRPSPDVGNVWQRPWWRRYTERLWRIEDGVTYRAIGMDEVIMSWDMAFKDTKSSDYVVGQVWGRRGAEVFLLDQIHDRLTFTETVAAFQRMVKKWPDATTKLVEDKANGTAVIDQLRKKIPGIVPENPTDSKYGRATSVAPFIEAGNVSLPEDNIALFNVGGFIDEAAAFPNGAHDDQVDGASQALRRLLLRPGQGSAWLEWMKAKAAKAAAEAAEKDTTTPVPA